MRAVGTYALGLVLLACGTESPTVWCGPGTTLVDGQCSALAAPCGEGAVLEDGRCVPESEAVVCGDGAEVVAGVCVPSTDELRCGEGTESQNGECVAVGGLVCGGGTVEAEGMCVSAFDEVICGAGTELVEGVCDPLLFCAEGTVEVEDSCVPAFPEVICGLGTIEAEGECAAAYSEVRCGLGTAESDGVCEVAADFLICGEGTEEVEGACFPFESLHECGPDTFVGDDGTCQRVARPLVQAPLAAGTEAPISQCNFGYFSHSGDSAYAVDISVPTGTELLAVRSGTVVAFREDSETGCGDVSCADQANWILIAHDDGTHAAFYHLDTRGVLVDLGERVCAGQVVALSGNTGFSTGPHLHLEVRDIVALASQYGFEELEPITGGAPVTGVTLAGSVTEPALCGDSPTLFNTRTYEHRGVLLAEATPRAVEIDRVYSMSGVVTDGSALLQVARWRQRESSWAYDCYPVDEVGEFAIDLTWTSEFHDPGSAYFHLSAAFEDCSVRGGWSTSPRIALVAPSEG